MVVITFTYLYPSIIEHFNHRKETDPECKSEVLDEEFLEQGINFYFTGAERGEADPDVLRSSAVNLEDLDICDERYPLYVLMKYANKKYSIKFKLLFKEGVLTLELYLPKPTMQLYHTGHLYTYTFLLAFIHVSRMVIHMPCHPISEEILFFGFMDIEYA